MKIFIRLLVFFAVLLGAGCHEGFTRANRLSEKQSTVTAGVSGMEYTVFSALNSNGQPGFGDYYLSYEYDMTQNAGLLLLFDHTLYHDSSYLLGMALVIDFMPKDWLVHLIITPGLGYRIPQSQYSVSGYFFPTGCLAINIGNETLQGYGACSILLMPKLETGVYWYPSRQFFIKAYFGDIVPMSCVCAVDQTPYITGYLYAGISLGLTW